VAKRMSILGAGPVVAVFTGLYLAATIWASFGWPLLFAIDAVPYPWLAAAGVLLFVAAAPVYAVTVRTTFRAYRENRLVTTGAYAICRHPLYALWILLIVPGVALLLKSWLVLTVALFMYVATRIAVRREEEELESLFGEEYVDYKNRVGAIFPTLGRVRLKR